MNRELHKNDSKNGGSDTHARSDTGVATGRIGSGGQDAPRTTSEDVNLRGRTIEYALDLHRGKSMDATQIVQQAAVLESYLRDGTAAPVVVTTPAAPDSIKMPAAV